MVDFRGFVAHFFVRGGQHHANTVSVEEYTYISSPQNIFAVCAHKGTWGGVPSRVLQGDWHNFHGIFWSTLLGTPPYVPLCAHTAKIFWGELI